MADVALGSVADSQIQAGWLCRRGLDNYVFVHRNSQSTHSSNLEEFLDVQRIFVRITPDILTFLDTGWHNYEVGKLYDATTFGLLSIA